MCSQIDMFATQPDPVDKETVQEDKVISSSCPAKLNSMFKWVCLFEWDENLSDPFKIFSASRFKEIKDAWIKSILSTNSRQKKIVVEGKTMSLFGKCDAGKYTVQTHAKHMRKRRKKHRSLNPMHIFIFKG